MKRLLPLLLALIAIPTAASPIPDFPFIAVSGDASTEVPPDTAVVTFTILVHDASSEAATKQVNETVRRITGEILAMGVPKAALTSDDLSKRMVRERGKNYQKLNVLGYDVSRDVKVEIRSLERYTAVVRLIMKTGNTNSVSSEFDTTKRNEVEAELLGDACADAKQKALLLSKGVGANLGGVFAISDRDFSSLYDRFGFGYSGGGGGAFGDGEDDEIPVFVPAKIDIHANVEVLYRLDTK